MIRPTRPDAAAPAPRRPLAVSADPQPATDPALSLRELWLPLTDALTGSERLLENLLDRMERVS